MATAVSRFKINTLKVKQMSITNISQNRVTNEQPTTSVAAKKNAVGKKDSEGLSTQGNSQVTLSKMSQILGNNEPKQVAEKEDLSSGNFDSKNMMQAQSGNITPEFVASLLDRNPYTSA